jgi:predicted methyltransferase
MFGIGGTADPKAHDLYLRARQLVRRELEAEARGAAELFRDAARHDPRFALAFAGLADVLAQIARLLADNNLKPLHEDPRFKALIERMA